MIIVPPCEFIGDVLRDPDNDGQPFTLYPEQRRFLTQALTVTPEGRLPYPELVFGAPKKSGKTATAAMAMLYVIIALGGRHAEGYCCANDLDQAQGRVYKAVKRIIAASPMLADTVTVTQSRITFDDSDSTIEAIAADYAGAAGCNPTFVVFDELWAYTSESSRRLWDELVPVPTRKISARLTTTYAGFEGESLLLESLHRRGMQGELIA